MFNWVSFLTYAVVTAATPGPNNIMSMSNAGSLGLKRSLPFNFGIWAGFSIVMLVCTFFCNAMGALLPRIKLVMLIAGAAYMLYLAWKTFRGSGEIEAERSRGGFLPGLFLQFINPKIYIYAVVSLEAYILPFYQGDWGALIFFSLLLAFIGFVFTLCWALFGCAFRLLFSKYARIANTVMALLLVYCAVSLFF